MPWDERIHAVSQSTKMDGTWRYRRGVEPELIKEVEAELLEKVKAAQREGFDAPVKQVAPPPPLVTPVVAPVVAEPPPPPPIVVTPPPPVNVAPMPLPTAMAHSVATFKGNLVGTLARLVSEGRLTQAYVSQLKNYFKVENIWEVNDQQAAEMYENFVIAGLIERVEA
jgi:hypothetical protein